jgi:hypothetical protein
MKKTTLIFLQVLYCSILCFGQNQDAISFNENLKVTYIKTCTKYLIPDTTVFSYSIKGDTIIQQKTYKKLCIIKNNMMLVDYEPIGGIREQDNRMYYIGKEFLGCQETKSEILLYDFNTKTGASFFQYRFMEPLVMPLKDIKQSGKAFMKQNKYKVYGTDLNPEIIIEGNGKIFETLVGMIGNNSVCDYTYKRANIKNTRESKVSLYKSATTENELTYFENDVFWTYKEIYNPYWDFYMTHSVIFSLHGDTVVENKKYHLYYDETGMSGIRQENQKVYARRFNIYHYYQQDEFLLYDFSVKAGDTIHTNATSGYISRLPVVSKTDTILMENGESRKRIFLGWDTWIEGIGSMSGLLYPSEEMTSCGGNSRELISFTNGTKLLYNDSAMCANYGCYKSSVDAIPVLKNVDLKEFIYPNPAFNKISISTGILSEPCIFELMDVHGNIVLHSVVSTNSNSVNLSGYTNGLYLYRLLQNGKMIKAGKIVKM